MDPSSVLAQLRQRKLVQWGLAYIAGAWLVLQVVDVLADRWAWAASLGRPLDILLIVGFGVALVLAWYHGEKGHQKVTGPELVMLAVLFGIAGLGVMAVSPRANPAVGPAVAEEGVVDPRSVVVLPFRNVSSDPEQEYFADGLTLELIGVLGQVPGLSIQGSSSSFAFKENRPPPAEIAAQLSVATLVSGSVRRSADRLRIDAELIEGATGLQMWSATFDEALSDQFELQERIAREVASAFQIEVGLEEVTASSTTSLEAHDLYLRAQGQLMLNTAASLDSAESLFHEATRIDQEYAAAWAGLGQLLTFQADAYAAPIDVLPQARAAAQRAVAIDNNVDAQLVLAYVDQVLTWSPREALPRYDAILARNPNLPIGYLYRSLAALFLGERHLDTALRDANRLIQLEQGSPIGYFMKGFFQTWVGQHEDAIETERQLQALFPGYIYIESPGAVSLRALGRFDEALAIYESALAAAPDETFSGHATTLAMAGRRAEAEAMLPAVEARAEAPYAPRSMVASVHAALGNTDEMFAWLERGYDEYDAWLWWVPIMPEFDPYRTDTRMIDLMARVGIGDSP